MLRRAALAIALVALATPAAVAPAVSNTYMAHGTAEGALGGAQCGSAPIPVTIVIGLPNAASQRPALLTAAEGFGTGTTADDPLVTAACDLVWQGTVRGSAAEGFVGGGSASGGPGGCPATLRVEPLGAATPFELDACIILHVEGTLDFTPFVTR